MENSKKLKFDSSYLFLFILYLSLLFGFYLGENLNIGSKSDWHSANMPVIEDFASDFKNTFLNYDKYGHRHSPVYLIFLSLFKKLGLDFTQIRFLHLNICLSLIFLFYKCLKIKFEKINSKYLLLLSTVIFLSPTFRSICIWPDTRLPGLIIFLLSIYFILILQKTKNIKYAWYGNFSLIFSSYISPNFSLFIIFYFFIFLKLFKIQNLIPLIFANVISVFPILYYLFAFDINFLTAGLTPSLNGEAISLSYNISNKLLIISSILLFHLFPILFLDQKFLKEFFNYIKVNFYKFFIILIVLVFFFNYETAFTGGGVFFQISNLLFKNNYFFYLICFISLSLIFFFSNKSINNFILIFLSIISNIQNTIYHKYYDPFFLILFYLLFEKLNSQKYLRSRTLVSIYVFSIIYIFLRVYKIRYAS